MDRHRTKQYVDVVFLRCVRLLQDRDMAMEATQEVITRFLEMTQQKQIEEPLRYLYRSSTHHCFDLLQKQKRDSFMPVETLLLRKGITDHHKAEGKLMYRQLQKIFTRDEVALLLHRYVDQMTYNELGKLYERTDRAIKKRIDRLEQRLMAYLDI